MRAPSKNDPPPEPPGNFWEWQVPLALFLLGAGGIVALAGWAEGFHGVNTAPLFILLVLVLNVPPTILLMYPIAWLLGITYGLLGSAIFKMAALLLFTLALSILGEQVGAPLFPWILSIAATLVYFSHVFDLDARDTLLSVVLISIFRFLFWALTLMVAYAPGPG